MGAYLSSMNSKYNKESSDSIPFFKKVDSLIPVRKMFSSSNDRVPELSGAIEPTVYNEGNKQSFFSRISALFGSSGSSKNLDDEMDDLPPQIKEEVYELEDELEEVDHEVEELEEKRESLIKRFFSLFRSNHVSDDEEESEFEEPATDVDPSEVLKSETRQTLKIIHKWISRLPPEQIDAFKRSPDFARYKDLLDKYNLLK